MSKSPDDMIYNAIYKKALQENCSERAAQYFVAKSDVRYYLKGIYISPEGFIAATNGHILFYVECEETKKFDEPYIINIANKIPARGESAQIQFYKNKKKGEPATGLITYLNDVGAPVKRNSLAVCNYFETIDGKFPDVKRVMPKNDLEPVANIAVDANYLAVIANACRALRSKYMGCVMRFRGITTGIEVGIETPGYGEPRVIIMPMRM
jgi:hypothetical protein